MRWIIVLIVIVGLIAWGGILEENAESSAMEFCDSIVVGSSYLETVEKAKSIGEDRLRIIREESIAVGFTGIPPFSRHVCEITRDGDKVGEKQYFYID